MGQDDSQSEELGVQQNSQVAVSAQSDAVKGAWRAEVDVEGGAEDDKVAGSRSEFAESCGRVPRGDAHVGEEAHVAGARFRALRRLASEK